MFTGIIEEIGELMAVQSGSDSMVLTIKAQAILEGVKVGDSIATNGVCLTVIELGRNLFKADVMHETLNRSGLGALKTDSPVNLERAMRADGRFGGHIVSGHIDGTGVIKSYRREENAVWITVEADQSLLRLIVEKGSVCVDGVSLTVAAVSDHDFQVSVIPHTGEETTLLKKGPGGKVNLENDVVGKYVERLLGAYGRMANHDRGEEEPPSGGITMEFLREYL